MLVNETIVSIGAVVNLLWHGSSLQMRNVSFLQEILSWVFGQSRENGNAAVVHLQPILKAYLVAI